MNAVVHAVFDKADPEKLGTDYNPLPSILEEVINRLPEGWAAYLKWRARHRREPEAEWLMKLPAQERKAKRRKRPAGD